MHSTAHSPDFSLQVPGGVTGLIALGVTVPVTAFLCLRVFGLVTCATYLVPVGIAAAIIYAERTLASHED